MNKEYSLIIFYAVIFVLALIGVFLVELPGFWRGAYADLRKDLRGRYPRHPWAERPWEAEPTRRAKPRGR